MANEKIRIVSLGGADEDGKNCIVVEINDDIFVVGCGIKHPDKTMPGIDYIIPNFDYLKANKDRVKAYFLLHGHDDDMAALAYLYEDVPAPIYGSKVTLTLFKMFTKHARKDKIAYKFIEVLPTSDFKVANRLISYFHTSHNVADSSGIAISTEYGNIVITSDFVVENNATPAYLHDTNAIARIADRGTLVLLTESIYATRAGYTAPMYRISPHIEEQLKDAKGRTFIAMFASNFYNIDEVIMIALHNRKTIIPYDDETADILRTMEEASAAPISKNLILPLTEINRVREQDLIVLMLAHDAKAYSKIALLASGQIEDYRLKLRPTDTFIVACPYNNNTEVESVDAIDELYRSGCNVYAVSKKNFYRMHACVEDIKTMISVLKPKYYLPVKGMFMNLLCNAQIAAQMGVKLNHTNIFLVDNGVSLLIDEKGARMFDEKIPHGDIMIDGIGVGDVSPAVVQDREKLAQGVIIIAAMISKSKQKLVAGPDVQVRGLVYLKDSEILVRDVTRIFNSCLEDHLSSPYYDIRKLKDEVYDKVLRMVRRQSGKEPMVLPLLTEVE
ncbi:MAG: ribonuclease J [Bacilli bacterium]|nr:ribonuclease J [Bacilli bacterium]